MYSIEVKRGDKGRYLFHVLSFPVLFIFCLLLPEFRIAVANFFLGQWNWSKIMFAGIIVVYHAVLSYCYFDRSVRIRINKEGVWTPRYKFIPWKDVRYFHSTAKWKGAREGYVFHLLIRLRDTETGFDKTVRIRIHRVDTTFEEIRKVFASYASKHAVEDLGHEKRNKITLW